MLKAPASLARHSPCSVSRQVASQPRLSFGSDRQDPTSRAVARVLTAAQRAEAAAAATAAAAQEDSDDDGLLDFGRDNGRVKRQRQQVAPAWWQQPGKVAGESPAAPVVRFGLDRRAAAAAGAAAGGDEDTTQQQQQEPQEQQQKRTVAAGGRASAPPGTPPAHFAPEVEVSRPGRAHKMTLASHKTGPNVAWPVTAVGHVHS